MTQRMASSILCVGLAVLSVSCATKTFVRDRVDASQNKVTGEITAMQRELTERAKRQEAELRETAARTGENRRAVDAADQRIGGLDTRVDEVSALAEGAKTRADSAAMSAQDAEARLNQRFAGRNRYRLIETKSVYFDTGQIELRSQDTSALDEIARALAKDPNAILELQGFADPQGGDRYNRDLARERVEAVIRYLMQRHGVELRQLQGITMGKVPLGAGEKPSADVLAGARRVDMKLFAPWSSWEDSQPAASPPDQPEPSALPRAAVEDTSEPPPSPYRRLLELLETVTPKDLRDER